MRTRKGNLSQKGEEQELNGSAVQPLSGKICGDTMQKAFLEWTYTKFEVEKLSQVQHFRYPACKPSMLAVAVDGNRKLYRFKSQPGPGGFFVGVFLAKDSEVSSFVDYIHGTTKHNPAKGRCGTSQWAAARESANKSASKVDEEVRTDILTLQAIGWNRRKAENLDRALAKRYIKTMQRITEATKEINIELSLEEDTVKQWVSDVQQWTTGPTSPNDLQKTIEGLYLSIKQRKFQLYRQSDGNKRRHQLRKTIVVEKKSLEDAIIKHNATVEETDKLPPPNELLADDNYSWQWECHGDMVQKKKVFDKVMLLSRLKEEAVIVVREHLAQGHFGMQMGQTGDRTADLQVGGRPLYPSATAAPVGGGVPGGGAGGGGGGGKCAEVITRNFPIRPTLPLIG
ncbi:unnamed protein product [Pleuronectes platessa]|uniref:Uncharacterized protein n=1 Tax=Pleuronectes platessa TaxID=8262 RepID=A0A9N7W388_PLEPL|nr:unnamed protein product [Pleuronectes platessa]